MKDLLSKMLPPEGWQPASSAPKDGTPFLGWEDGLISVCYWGAPDITTITGGRMSDTWICVLIIGPATPRSAELPTLCECIGSEFSHWMMLPKGPE